MLKKVILILMIALLLFLFRNHLFFYYQVQRLKDHLEKEQPCEALTQKLCQQGSLPKVWAHRVDSYERFEFLSKTFRGMEVDLVYDRTKNIFDVGHPPAKSIGLTFESFLQHSEGHEKYFWLDLKNLDELNVKSVLLHLDKLDQKYQIRKRVILESGDIYSLSKISAAGYFTSFYYDEELYRLFRESGPPESTDSVFATIDAVSNDVLDYKTLVKQFPTKTRLTWALSSRYYFDDSMFSALDADAQLLIYLVNIKSPGYR